MSAANNLEGKRINVNANINDNSCEYMGCTNFDAENYDSTATIDDGSCIVYGCTISAWFICPESYNPNATVNDWSMCTFTWNGCTTASIEIPLPGSYPTIELSDITDDEVDAYYYLGPDKVGCMDDKALNYSRTAVINNASCIYNRNQNIDYNIHVYPQPAITHFNIEVTGEKAVYGKEISVHNILGEVLYAGTTSQEEVININTNNWNTGVYYVVIKMENKNLTYKFAVE